MAVGATDVGETVGAVDGAGVVGAVGAVGAVGQPDPSLASGTHVDDIEIHCWCAVLSVARKNWAAHTPSIMVLLTLCSIVVPSPPSIAMVGLVQLASAKSVVWNTPGEVTCTIKWRDGMACASELFGNGYGLQSPPETCWHGSPV